MSRRGAPKNFGYTLVEIMIAITAISALVAVGNTAMLKFMEFYSLNTTRIELQMESRKILDHMTRHIHQARASTCILSQDSGQPSYSKISFTTVDNKNFIYSQNGTRLTYWVNGLSANDLSKNLKQVSFFEPQTTENTIVGVMISFEKTSDFGRKKTLQVGNAKIRIMN